MCGLIPDPRRISTKSRELRLLHESVTVLRVLRLGAKGLSKKVRSTAGFCWVLFNNVLVMPVVPQARLDAKDRVRSLDVYYSDECLLVSLPLGHDWVHPTSPVHVATGSGVDDVRHAAGARLLSRVRGLDVPC